MEFDIDVSGEDIFDKDYTICLANQEGVIKGFKFNPNISNSINPRYGQGIYRYAKSKKGKSSLKIRIYCIVIYYLFKGLKISEPIKLNICKDFDGKEPDIRSNLEYFLTALLKIKIDNFNFSKLDKYSNAHNYSYLMRKDIKNKLKTYVKIEIKQIEKFLKK